MAMSPRTSIVGVFRDRAMAEQAMQALTDAGFDRDQIRYAHPGAPGNFFKSLFTDQGTTSNNLTNDLADMGVPDEQAQYYANEYSNGSSIIAMKAPGREQEAMSIMNRYGAYNHPDMAAVGSGTASTQQSYDPNRTNNTLPDDENAAMRQRKAARERSTPEGQLATNAAATQPVQSARMVQPDQQAAMAPQSARVAQPSQPADDLQTMQAQLQATQRQLQEVRSQLQAAKEREAQLQATHEHEAQLQSMRKQLQEAQAQLQASQAELQATQERIAARSDR